MRVARLMAPGVVEIMDEARPEPKAGESLVRVGAVGLCGSDLHWFGEGAIGDAVLSRPLVLGHEFGGTVEGARLTAAVSPSTPPSPTAPARGAWKVIPTSARTSALPAMATLTAGCGSTWPGRPGGCTRCPTSSTTLSWPCWSRSAWPFTASTWAMST